MNKKVVIQSLEFNLQEQIWKVKRGNRRIVPVQTVVRGPEWCLMQVVKATLLISFKKYLRWNLSCNKKAGVQGAKTIGQALLSSNLEPSVIEKGSVDIPKKAKKVVKKSRVSPVANKVSFKSKKISG